LACLLSSLFAKYRHKLSAVPTNQPERKFKVGGKIRVNLHHGKIEDTVAKTVIEGKDGLKLQVEFEYEQTAHIHTAF